MADVDYRERAKAWLHMEGYSFEDVESLADLLADVAREAEERRRGEQDRVLASLVLVGDQRDKARARAARWKALAQRLRQERDHYVQERRDLVHHAADAVSCLDSAAAVRDAARARADVWRDSGNEWKARAEKAEQDADALIDRALHAEAKACDAAREARETALREAADAVQEVAHQADRIASKSDGYHDLAAPYRCAAQFLRKAAAAVRALAAQKPAEPPQREAYEPPAITFETELDLDLLAKLASVEGGRRTGALRRAGYLEWTVTPAGREALLRRAIKSVDISSLPTIAPPEVRSIGPLPAEGYVIRCCDHANPVYSATEIEVEGKRYIRAEARCGKCDRVNTQFFEKEEPDGR